MIFVIMFKMVAIFGFGWKIVQVSCTLLCVVSFSCFSGIVKNPVQTSSVCSVYPSYELF
jgi:hypothetical protein